MSQYLEIDHVSIDFPTKNGPFRALDGVDLNIAKGEFVSLIGHSGCGKSTVLNIVAGLYNASEGGVVLEGKEVYQPGPDRAVVFQNHSLLPWLTAYQNVELAVKEVFKGQKSKAEMKQWIEHNLELVHMSHAMHKRPDEISGGMKQRVGIARALAMQPKVLLMDEPFSALDPLIRRQLQDEFIKLSAMMNKTTVFITHDLDEAVRIGDRIAIMHDGRLVQVGTAEDIVMNPANDYVADFVAGISRLKIVKAHAVMQPMDKHIASVGPIPEDAPEVNEDASLSELIELAINSDAPIIVQDNGQQAGVITRADILQTVIEGAETS